MYVFVDIGVDVRHLVATVAANFPPGTNLALAGTIQFGSSIQVHAYVMTLSMQALFAAMQPSSRVERMAQASLHISQHLHSSCVWSSTSSVRVLDAGSTSGAGGGLLVAAHPAVPAAVARRGAFPFVNGTMHIDACKLNFPASLSHPCAPCAYCWLIQTRVSPGPDRSAISGRVAAAREPRRNRAAPQVLGCTAPVVPPETDAIIFVADGRFHLEAIMIANPAVPAFRCGSASSCRVHTLSLVIRCGKPKQWSI